MGRDKMKYSILRWLLGIWLVEAVTARHILNGEDTGTKQSRRGGRDQFHPLYQQTPHLNYNSFRSPLRRPPPQVPGHRNLVDPSSPSQGFTEQQQEHYNNYFGSHYASQNTPNLNLYSAVRLHGALETRARNEAGSPTLIPTHPQQHVNYFHPPQQQSPQQKQRHWRREEENVDGESYEREDDLARFSLYNSYFDNEHSIKALNSMKCVTPTGSAGFCSTFRGCVPSFFTKEGDLEAPALAELISTSIGYCTTNVSHHFIREQKQFVPSGSREERRFNSVANRIICCPGVAPDRDPNQDPDKIFNDYIESQKQKTSTTTTTTTTTTSTTTIPPPPAEEDNGIDGGASDSQPEAPVAVGASEDNVVHDGQGTNPEESQSVQQPVEQPVESAPVKEEQPSSSAPVTEQPSEAPVSESVSTPQQDSESASLDESHPSVIQGDNQQVDQATSSPSVAVSVSDSVTESVTQTTSQAPAEGVIITSSELPTTSQPESVSSSSSSVSPVEPEEPSAPTEAPSSLPQVPSNDEAEAPAEEASATEQPTSPGKLPPPDSNIIKIYPDPVSGVNGKFTLPGAIYIVSPSTDTSNNAPSKPAAPSGEAQVSDGTLVVGSKPIIIVTRPEQQTPPPPPPSGVESDALPMPHFPSDFPPMGSQENQLPPVDDSSLELQQRPRPSQTVPTETSSSFMTYPTSTSSSSELPQTTSNSPVAETTLGMQYPPSSSSSSSDQPEVPVTTTANDQALQQDESVGQVTTQRVDVVAPSDLHNNNDNNLQQDESDSPATTTLQPEQPSASSVASVIQDAAGDNGMISDSVATTASPLMDDAEDGGNDAVTIIPILPSSPSTTTTTTEASEVAQEKEQQNKASEITTTLSSVSGIREEEFTTRQAPSAAAEAGLDSQPEELQEATTTAPETLQQQQQQQQLQEASTLPPVVDSEEDNESSEEKAVTGAPAEAEAADVEKTTQSENLHHHDFVATPTTTVATPAAASQDEPAIAAGDIHDEDESIPSSTTVANSGSNNNGQNDVTTLAPVSPSQPESQNMVMHPPSGPSIPESPVDENAGPPKIILNPGSEAIDSAEMETGGTGAIPSEPQPAHDDETGYLPAMDTMQPFPAASPEGTGEAGGSEQQQPVVVGQPEEESVIITTTTSTAAPIPVNNQPFPDPELSTTTIPPSSHADGQPSADGVGEQSASTTISESSATPESTWASNVGVTTGLPPTSSPGNLQFDELVPESESAPAGDSSAAGGGEQQTTSTITANNDATEQPNGSGGAETATSQPSGVSGIDTVPVGTQSAGSGSESSTVGTESPATGSESLAPGSESSAFGTESSAGGSEPLVPGTTESPESGNDDEPAAAPVSTGNDDEPAAASSQGDGAFEPGSELPAMSTTPESANSSSQLPDSSDSTSESAPIPSADEPEHPEQSVPAAAEQSEQQQPSNDESVTTSELPISTSSPAAPSSTAAAAGGATETPAVPQEPVSSVSSDASQDASAVSGSAPQADSPVSSDDLQNPQPVESASPVPEDVSSSASPEVVGSEGSTTTTYPPSTTTVASSTEVPTTVAPTYQILKACKFQSFFRSLNDQTFSYRHYPWLATIVGGTRPFSSGTLITDRHILTASHFLSNITVSDVFNMRIHVGYRTSYSGQTEGPYAVRKVRKVIRHKGFSFEKLYNDIAVLVLDRPVRFSEDIYPVCLSSNRSAYADGNTEAFETGWIEDPRQYTISQHHNYVDPHIQKYFSFGYKNITWRLQEAPQKVKTNPECQSNYSFLEKNGIMITDSMVCAGSNDTRSCAFRGNSGAPLFLRNQDDKMTEQIGLVSFGVGCSFLPQVYTRIESFLPWLDRVVYNSR